MRTNENEAAQRGDRGKARGVRLTAEPIAFVGRIIRPGEVYENGRFKEVKGAFSGASTKYLSTISLLKI